MPALPGVDDELVGDAGIGEALRRRPRLLDGHEIGWELAKSIGDMSEVTRRYGNASAALAGQLVG